MSQAMHLAKEKNYKDVLLLIKKESMKFYLLYSSSSLQQMLYKSVKDIITLIISFFSGNLQMLDCNHTLVLKRCMCLISVETQTIN